MYTIGMNNLIELLKTFQLDAMFYSLKFYVKILIKLKFKYKDNWKFNLKKLTTQ